MINKNYAVSGKSTTIKNYANVQDTIDAIQRIIRENYPAVANIAQNLEANSYEETFRNIWNFVRGNVRYQNDESGVEQLRTPQRTLYDRTGDCDDMSILISSILCNLGINHELIVAAYKSKNEWQHIYPAAFDKNGNRYVIDCVPEIPYFNYEAKPIKNQIIIKMRLEELGQGFDDDLVIELTEPFDINSLQGFEDEDDEIEGIQALLGNVALVDEDDEYDAALSGSELKENVMLKQLMDAKNALQKENSNPTELSQLNDNKLDFQLVTNIIDNFQDVESRNEAIEVAIRKGTLYQNFYKAILIGVDEVVNGLAGEDEEIYYLKLMNEDFLNGFSDLGAAKAKENTKKLNKKEPFFKRVGHALKKFNPAMVALRKSMDLFLRANVFHLAEKLAVGYATEVEAKKLGYSRQEWLEYVKAKDQAETKWNSLGGEKTYFQKMIKNSKGAKKAGLKGELGIAPAVIAAVTKVFGTVISFFKKLKLKKPDGSIVDEKDSPNETVETNKNLPANYKKSLTKNTETEMERSTDAPENANVETHEKSGVTTETVKDENGKETKVYKDKDGNEIGKFKAFFLKNKLMIIIVSIILVVGIIAIIIWKARQRALHGLAGGELSPRQENFIRRQGLNNRAYASLVREEISKDGKPYNEDTRRTYYKKVFTDAFNRPISEKQVSATINHNSFLKRVGDLAKANGGGSDGWRKAWAEIKKKSPIQKSLKFKG